MGQPCEFQVFGASLSGAAVGSDLQAPLAVVERVEPAARLHPAAALAGGRGQAEPRDAAGAGEAPA
jgi:hypothetical protein